MSKHSITYFVDFSSRHDLDRWLIRIHNIAVPMRMVPTGGMRQLPSEMVKYTQVPGKGRFIKDTIPRGLLKEHTTKSGTWGVIIVSKGQLRYQINEPSVSVYILDSENKGIIEPQVKHEVAPLTDDVEFVVEFYRLPGTGPVVETREGFNE